MSKRLTIDVDTDVYEGLKRSVGEAGIGRFLSDLARPHVVPLDLAAGYSAMADDEDREIEAMDWVEGTIENIALEPRHGR